MHPRVHPDFKLEIPSSSITVQESAIVFSVTRAGAKLGTQFVPSAGGGNSVCSQRGPELFQRPSGRPGGAWKSSGGDLELFQRPAASEGGAWKSPDGGPELFQRPSGRPENLVFLLKKHIFHLENLFFT